MTHLSRKTWDAFVQHFAGRPEKGLEVALRIISHNPACSAAVEGYVEAAEESRKVEDDD